MPLLLLLADWVSAVVPAAMVLTAPLHCRGRAGAAPPPDGSIVSRQFSYRPNPRRCNMDDRPLLSHPSTFHNIHLADKKDPKK